MIPAGDAGRGDPGRGGEAPSVEEALARAARHSRNAAAEALAAARALLDALAIATGGAPADSHAALSGAARWLDELARQLSGGPGEAAITRALADALEAEIARWEERAREDPDARAVLRAFLGLRELLWELGLRPRSESAPGEPSEPPPPPQGRAESRAPDPAASGRTRRRPPRSESAQAATGSRAPRRRRVQRVDVER